MPTTSKKRTVTCKVCGSEFYPGEKWQIWSDKLLLAEGTDVHRLLIYAVTYYQKFDVQVINFGGIDELRLFIENLHNMANFSKVKTLVIARDAETNVVSAIDKVQSAIQNVNLPVPIEPFQYKSNEHIKTAFMLFPGHDDHGQCRTGTVEDLCLATVADDPLLDCVNNFLKCAQKNQENDEEIKHPWKSKIYAYLAGKDDHAGKKLGQAAKDRVWKFDHFAMTPFKKIIQKM